MNENKPMFKQRIRYSSLLISIVVLCLNAVVMPAKADIIYEGCSYNVDCNDGVFCNGEEICHVTRQRNSKGVIVKQIGTCQAGVKPCQRGWQCRNTEKICKEPCEDKDGDGFTAQSCGGDDCDDRDPNRFPGNPEICDAAGIDEDCNPRTVGDIDKDGDGYLSPLCR